MTNFKPMLFSTDMVKAILNGTKTQTRRIVKYNKKIEEAQIGFSVFSDSDEFEVRGVHENGDYGISLFKKPINKGDIIWVRETFGYSKEGKLHFAANVCSPKYDKPCNGWKPSLFMPKQACRLFLEVTNIRIENLQKISRGDCMSEGCPFQNIAKETNPNEWYQNLWIKLNGQNSWEENPFVWVYTFKVVGRPENFC
jgi:hypothetical protein